MAFWCAHWMHITAPKSAASKRARTFHHEPHFPHSGISAPCRRQSVVCRVVMLLHCDTFVHRNTSRFINCSWCWQTISQKPTVRGRMPQWFSIWWPYEERGALHKRQIRNNEKKRSSSFFIHSIALMEAYTHTCTHKCFSAALNCVFSTLKWKNRLWTDIDRLPTVFIFFGKVIQLLVSQFTFIYKEIDITHLFVPTEFQFH